MSFASPVTRIDLEEALSYLNDEESEDRASPSGGYAVFTHDVYDGMLALDEI